MGLSTINSIFGNPKIQQIDKIKPNEVKAIDTFPCIFHV